MSAKNNKQAQGRGSPRPNQYEFNEAALPVIARIPLLGSYVMSRPWLYAFYRFLLVPILYVPFLPVVMTAKAWKGRKIFEPALSILAENGLPTGPNVSLKISESIHELKLASGIKKVLLAARLPFAIYAEMMGRPTAHPIASESIMLRRLSIQAIFLWCLSVFLLSVAISSSLTNGVGFIRTMTFVWGTFTSISDFAFMLGRRGAIAYYSIFFALASWLFALMGAVAVSNRRWMRLRPVFEDFLLRKYFTKDFDAFHIALPTDHGVFLSFPSANAQSLRVVRGWPGGFEGGRILKSISRPSDYLILPPPTLSPPVFAQPGMSISTHFDIWKKEILETTRRQLRASNKDVLFLGEIIDPRVKSFNRAVSTFDDCPHIWVLGKTGSGKTKTMQSLVFTLHQLYPDSEWIFADGKLGQDFSDLAEKLSIYPVAKEETKESDHLVQFANVVTYVYDELKRRQKLYDPFKASNVDEFRARAAESGTTINRMFFLVDEFPYFMADLDFDANANEPGTLAFYIRTLLAQARSYGIHLIFGSQRFQVSDMPSVMKGNLTTQFIHALNAQDATGFEIPEAKSLMQGEYILRGSGLNCDIAALDVFRCRMPFVGVAFSKLLDSLPEKKGLAARKADFDRKLIYNKGKSDLNSMNMEQFGNRIARVLREQGYAINIKIKDVEADLVPYEAWKLPSDEDTPSASDHVYLEGDEPEESRHPPINKRIAVCIMRPEEFSDDKIEHIVATVKQDGYVTVLVFVKGLLKDSALKSIKRINEGGVRVVVYAQSEFHRMMRTLENHRRKPEQANKKLDLLEEKLSALGQGKSTIDSAKGMDSLTATGASVPVRVKIAKILELVNLKKATEEGSRLQVNFLKTVFPGGRKVVFIIVASKENKEYVRKLADEFIVNERATIVICTTQPLTQTEQKRMMLDGVLVLTPVELNEYIEQAEREPMEFFRAFAKAMGILGQNGRDFKIELGSELWLKAEFAPDTGLISFLVVWPSSGHLLGEGKVYPENYTLSSLKLDKSHKITVLHGAAPLDALPERVTIAEKAKLLKFASTDRFTVEKGVLKSR